MSLPKKFQNISQLLSKLPSIGPRMAERISLYLISQPKHKLDELSEALKDLKSIKSCKICLNITENQDEICKICKNEERDKKTICVVESALDLIAVENKQIYKGVYHVIGGTIKIGQFSNEKNLKIDELEDRIEKQKVNEIIIATNPTSLGDATAVFIKEKFNKYKNLKITRISKGLPTGSSLEYADIESMQGSINGRKVF